MAEGKNKDLFGQEIIDKSKIKKRRCHNCKFGGDQFKVHKLTHLHCESPQMHKFFEDNPDTASAWDSLRVFNETCEDHEFKDSTDGR